MDYDNRLSHLRASIDDADRAVDKINIKLNQIHKNVEVLELSIISDPSDSSLPLERPRHKEFIENISMIDDITRNINQSVSTHKSTSPDTLKSSLQHEVAEHERTVHILHKLEKLVARLQSFNPSHLEFHLQNPLQQFTTEYKSNGRSM